MKNNCLTLMFVFSCLMVQGEEPDREQFWLEARDADHVQCPGQEMDVVLPDQKEDTETSITYDLYGPRNPLPENEWLEEPEISIQWVVTGLKNFNLQYYRDQKYCEIPMEKPDWGRDLAVTCYITYMIEEEKKEYEAEAHFATPTMEIEALYLKKGNSPALDITEFLDWPLEEGPDWRRGLACSRPFLYPGETRPIVTVELRILPEIFSSGKIRADSSGGEKGNLLGDLSETNFTMKDGVSLISKNKLGKSLKSGTQAWDWIITELHGTGLSKYTLRDTTELGQKGFIILKTGPVQPWVGKSSEIKEYESCSSAAVLEFVIEKIGCEGLSDKNKILEKITRYLFSSHGCRYISASPNEEVAQLKPPIYSKVFGAEDEIMLIGIRIEEYLELLLKEYVNCADQATALCALCNSVGVPAGLLQFNGSLFCKGLPVVGLKENEGKFYMTTHTVTTDEDKKISDATIGPAVREDPEKYISKTFKELTQGETEDEGDIFSVELLLKSVK